MIRRGWIVAGAAGLLAAGVLLGMMFTGGDPGGIEGSPSAPGPGGLPSPITWTGSVVVATGGGHVGPWRMNESVWRYVDDPTVALDSAGRAALAWVDQGRKDVLFRRFGPDGEPLPGEPVNVSRSPGVFSWLPRIAVSEGGDRVYLLWQEIVFSGGTHGGEAFFARSTDGGRTFGEPINLSTTPTGAGKGRMSPDRWHNGSLDLAPGPGGDLVAAWTVYEGGLFAARSTDGGGSFSDPVRVTGEGGRHEPARAPAVTADADGTVHLVWAVGEDAAADLRYVSAPAAAPRGEGGVGEGLSFGEPRILFEGGGHADAPALATGGGGELHLAWMESPAGVMGEGRIRYARASDAPAGPGPRFHASRVAAAPDGQYSAFRFPSMALDGSGSPVLLWELYREGMDHPRGLAVATSSVAASPGAEGTFGRPTVVPGTADPGFRLNGSLQGRLMEKLAVNGAGRIAVVNSGFEPGAASRILLVLGRLGR